MVTVKVQCPFCGNVTFVRYSTPFACPRCGRKIRPNMR